MPNASVENDIKRAQELRKLAKTPGLPSSAKAKLEAAAKRVLNRAANNASNIAKKPSSQGNLKPNR